MKYAKKQQCTQYPYKYSNAYNQNNYVFSCRVVSRLLWTGSSNHNFNTSVKII